MTDNQTTATVLSREGKRNAMFSEVKPTGLPIPVHGNRTGNSMAGSAFLLRGNVATWLVSCAYLVSGCRGGTPNSRDYFEHGVIRVLGCDLLIPLNITEPNRLGLVEGLTPNKLVDAMAIKLLQSEREALEAFGYFSLADVSEVRLGDQITIFGFPGIKDTPILAASLEGTVKQAEQESFSISVPSAVGYSGGPVISGARLVGIAAGDTGFAPDFEHGVVTSMAALAPFLRRHDHD